MNTATAILRTNRGRRVEEHGRGRTGAGQMTNEARVVAAILRTDRPLSSEFREQVAQMVEALDACVSALAITEAAHHHAGQPFYCDGLDRGRAALGLSREDEDR